MSFSSVAISNCQTYHSGEVREAINKIFELSGTIRSFISRGDSVLLKPNFIAPRAADTAAVTHPALVIETAKLLKDLGAKPFVADSPAWSNMKSCIQLLGLQKPLADLGVNYYQLDRPQPVKLEQSNVTVGISKRALQADRIINLPKLKAHKQMTMTIAVKNMFGCVSGKSKALWHYRKGCRIEDFALLIVEICKKLSPAITILDAVAIMEAGGPIRGIPRHFGAVIGSCDPVATEVVCCGMLGVDPKKLPILSAAKKIGYGCTCADEIEITGDTKISCLEDFVLPELIPVRFTLGRVIKSAAKQVMILIKKPSDAEM